MKKILILSMLSGFGHIKAAQALQEYADTNLSGVAVSHVDVSDISPRLKAYAKIYELTAKKFPFLWSFFYNKYPSVHFFSRLSMGLGTFFSGKMRDYLKAQNPDVIVFTNIFVVPMLAHDCKKLFPNATLAVTVTDYHGHPFYVFGELDFYFVAAQSVKEELAAAGAAPEKIKVTGIPISPAFYQNFDSVQLRKKYGIKNDFPIVLFIGSFRSSRAELMDTIDSLLKFQPDTTVIFVAAGDTEKYDAVSGRFGNNEKLFAVNWTDAMPELMALADVVVGKAGGLTVSECLHLKKPLIIVRPIPGQEEHNAVFVAQHNRGIKVNDPRQIVSVLPEMLALSQKLKAEPLDTSNACQKIFDSLLH